MTTTSNILVELAGDLDGKSVYILEPPTLRLVLWSYGRAARVFEPYVVTGQRRVTALFDNFQFPT